jgi:hypothetical protein
MIEPLASTIHGLKARFQKLEVRRCHFALQIALLQPSIFMESTSLTACRLAGSELSISFSLQGREF